MPGDRLSALDGTFLELEDADDGAHMHMGAVMVFAARPQGPPSLDELASHVERRLEAFPRYRRRLSQTHTGGLRWPEWVDDPGFRVADNVRRARLPEPGGEAELLEWIGDWFSHRLDRTRPLWEAVLVDGLEGGRWAIATKTHHALVDGIGSMGVGVRLLDGEPSPASEPPPPPPERGGDRSLREVASTLAHPRQVLERSRAAIGVLVKDELIPAPRTSLNVPIGGGRRYAVVHADLAAVRAAKRALGGSVNDMVLAAVTGGLRRLLLERGDELPEHGLRAMVPVDLRDGDAGLGNRVGSMFVQLPVIEPEPGRRYDLIRAQTAELKRAGQAAGTALITALAELAPPVLHATVARAAFATRLFNLTITNLHGPDQPLYGLGARLDEVLPLVPLAAEHSVGVAVVGYAGRLTFGLVADDRAVGDLDVLAAGVEESLAELCEPARAG